MISIQGRIGVCGRALILPLLVGSVFAQATDTGLPLTDESGASDEDNNALWRSLESLELEMQALKEGASKDTPGTHKFLWSGFASTRFIDMEGMDSTFVSTFNPILLYKMGDRFLFESELEFALVSGEEGGETEVDIGYAHGSYLVNDYLTVGAGKFLTPFGIFGERIHPAWINKLPNGPLLAGHNGIIPFASIGAYVRGGASTGSVKWNYSAYVTNGPRLNTGEDEPDEAGLLHFDNYRDNNNGKALGLRVGCLPVPELEIGASFLTADVTPSGSDVKDASANLYGIDLSYNPKLLPSKGRMEIRAEWALSDVDNVTYDPSGAAGFGPLDFDNRRNGGYVQVAYRLPGTNSMLSPWEGVVRYDTLKQPSGSPEPFDEDRVAFGVNYWLGPASVVKLAYQIDNKDDGEEDRNALFLQLVFGF